MGAAHIQIRRLTPADAVLYRDIRLEALKFNSEAYGTAFESEDARPLSWFADRLNASSVFGAFDGSELAGVATFSVGGRLKEAHKGLLRGVYVRPGARKAGVGRQLVETIIDFARQHVELIQLAVVNENARRLYASLGFVEYGIEKNSLKQDGRYYDQVLMALDL